jgi:uncharacterized membrane protein HdeD (DUF308 family)
MPGDRNISVAQVVGRSIKSGCVLSFGFACITSAIAAVLISLWVPGAWRNRPLLTDPGWIAVFIAAALGFVVGFVTALYRTMKSRRNKA